MKLRGIDPRAHLLLAHVLSGDATHDDERRAALERAVRLAPEDATALNSLAWYHVTHGHSADGLPLAFRSVQISPGNPFRLDTLAAALAGVGRCPEALHAEERVFEVASDGVSPQALQSLRKNEEKIRQTCAAPEAK